MIFNNLRRIYNYYEHIDTKSWDSKFQIINAYRKSHMGPLITIIIDLNITFSSLDCKKILWQKQKKWGASKEKKWRVTIPGYSLSEQWSHGFRGFRQPVIVSLIRKREMNIAIQVSFSFLISPGPQAIKWCLPHLGWIFLIHLSQSKKSLADTPREQRNLDNLFKACP